MIVSWTIVMAWTNIVPQEFKVAHISFQPQAISSRPPLQFWTTLQTLSTCKKKIFFMYEFKLILIYLGNHVSSLSKLIHTIKVHVFSIPSGCSGKFVPVVYNERYLCHLYESRAMNYSSAEKECLNLGADLVNYPTDFVNSQILVKLTGLY